MKLDKEQKKVLKAFLPSMICLLFLYPLLMWIFGKLDSWKDVFSLMGISIILIIILVIIYILGSKIPKKDE